MLPGSYPHRYGLYGLKHHIVEMRDGVTDAGQTMTNNKQVKIELLSQWKLEAEFRNIVLCYASVASYSSLEWQKSEIIIVLVGESAERKLWSSASNRNLTF